MSVVIYEAYNRNIFGIYSEYFRRHFLVLRTMTIRDCSFPLGWLS